MSAPVKIPVCVNSEIPPFSQRGKLTKLPIIPHSVLTMPIVFGPASSMPDGFAYWSGFREAGGDDAGGARAGVDALLDRSFHVLAWQHDVNQVYLFRQVPDSGIGLQSHNLGCVRIDRIKLTAKTTVRQVAEQNATGLVWIRRSTDHSDRARCNKGLNISHFALSMPLVVSALRVAIPCRTVLPTRDKRELVPLPAREIRDRLPP